MLVTMNKGIAIQHVGNYRVFFIFIFFCFSQAYLPLFLLLSGTLQQVS